MRELIDDAHRMGLRVLCVDLGARNGEYHHRRRVILLNERLSEIQQRSTLAHELGHASYGDDAEASPMTKRQEDRATLWAANRLIDPAEYALAERLVGSATPAIARELGVTRDLVSAWRRKLRDSGGLPLHMTMGP